MLKLTTEQLIKAVVLAEQIDNCEKAKDHPSGANVHFNVSITEGEGYWSSLRGLGSHSIPIERQVLIDAASKEISRCHEELEAMGISLMPSIETSYKRDMPLAFGTVFGKQ